MIVTPIISHPFDGPKLTMDVWMDGWMDGWMDVWMD